MTRYVFDFEATGSQRNKAHPFDYRNKACNVGFRNIDTGETIIYELEYGDKPYGNSLKDIQQLLDSATLLIGFNAKYDAHWLRRYNLVFSGRIFDCQVAWFILTNQKNKYPSLDQVAEYYGLEKKLDVVKTEYWNMGLDTDQVPYNILSEYLAQDLVVTENVYHKILEDITQQSIKMQKLISLSMQDLVVLEDIEWNGLLYNNNKSLTKGDELQNRIEEIDKRIKEITGFPEFNVNSGDQLSAILYGGTIYIPAKEEYIFVYKDGREALKTRNIKTAIPFKGLFKPIEGTELAKEGFYSTDVGTLTKLNEKAKGEPAEILTLLLTRSKIEKQRSTYFHGLPKKIEEMNWEGDIIHSNFNQCVTVSGRLSSSSPNVQNLEGSVKECFISRFKIRKIK